MKTRHLVFFVLALALLAGVRAEDLSCQYTVDETYVVDEDHWYEGSELLNGAPRIEEEVGLDVNRYNFRVYNPFEFPILLRIDYETLSNWYGNGVGGGQAEIPSKSSVWVETYHSNSGNIANRRISILEPELEHRLEKVTRTRLVCEQCLGKNCTNDGEACSNPEECGGKHCVSGYCSKTSTCHNNDCKCAAQRVQCPDNMRCVPTSSILIGGTPLCSPRECTTGFVNPQTGLCEKENCDANEVRCVDRRCVIVNTTEIGQAPNCRSEECKTGYLEPDTGLCAKKPFLTRIAEFFRKLFN